MLGTQGSLSSQISIRETRGVKHTVLSLQRKKWITCLLPRRLGMEVVESLVTSALSVGQATSGSPRFPQTGPEVINKLVTSALFVGPGHACPFSLDPYKQNQSGY